MPTVGTFVTDIRQAYTVAAAIAEIWSRFDGVALRFLFLYILSLRDALWMFSKEEATWLVVRRLSSQFSARMVDVTGTKGFFSSNRLIAFLVSLCRDGQWGVLRTVCSQEGDYYPSWKHALPSVCWDLSRITSLLIFSLSPLFTIFLRGAYVKFPDFFRMGTFIDSRHMKL